MRLSRMFLGGIILASLIFTASTSAAVPAATISYLQTQPKSNAWVVQALSASGQSVSAGEISASSLTRATDIERTIYAVVAAGENPYDFKGQNLVALLDGTRSNGQIGQENLINDDIFGGIAYAALDIPSSDQRMQDVKNVILQNQSGDGGWSFSVGSLSDSNMTAMAISALLHTGVSSSDQTIQDGVTYLKSAQNSDGGFGIGSGIDSDSASTSWVMSAIYHLGQDPTTWVKDGKTPFDFLQTLEQSDGSYKWKDVVPNSDPTMTSYVAIALAGKHYPVTKTTFTANDVAQNTQDTDQGNNDSQDSNGSDNQSGDNQTSDSTDQGDQTNSDSEQGNQGSDSSGDESSQSSDGTVTQPDTSGTPKVSYRIEGEDQHICQGETKVENALDLVEQVASFCGFTYEIEETSFGPYLKQINDDAPNGQNGWLYLVNWEQPSVGAQDYQLKSGDYVTWYWGLFTWDNLRTTATINGKDVSVLTESRGSSAGDTWSPLQAATVFIGQHRLTSDQEGKATIELSDGAHTLYATADDHVRSAQQIVMIGKNSNQSFNLSTTIVSNPGSNDSSGGGRQTPFFIEPEISFTVDLPEQSNGFAFGQSQPGQTKSQKIMLKNTGDVPVKFIATVTGSPLFKQFLKLNEVLWSLFDLQINTDQEQEVDVSLSIPNGDIEPGEKTGELIFWAYPVEL